MTPLGQHKIEITVSVQISQAGVRRSFGGLLKLDGVRKLPRRYRNENLEVTARNDAEGQNVNNYRHQFLLFLCLMMKTNRRANRPDERLRICFAGIIVYKCYSAR